MKHWFVFRTKPQREVRTVHELRERDFETRIIMRPDWERAHRKHKVKSILKPEPLPKWRPYIFLQVGYEDWHRLNSEELQIFAPVWPVGLNSAIPRPLSAAGVKLIHQSHREAFPDQDWERFSELPPPDEVLDPIDYGEGDEIRIVEGAFRGFEGAVVRLKGSHARILSPFFAGPIDIPKRQAVKAA